MSGEGIRVRRKRPRQFAQVPLGIARDPSLSDKALRLWVVLESYADYTERDCYPSIATLAKDLGCSTPTVHRVVKELAERGLLEVDSGKAEGRSNVYVIADPSDPGSITHDPPPSRAGDPPPTSPVIDRGTSPMIDKQESVERHSENETSDAKAPALPDEISNLCNQLADRVETHRGARPKITAQWPTDMDLLIRRGPTEWAEPTEIPAAYVGKVIDGIFTVLAERDAGGFCWADQVRSPGALRRHWDACLLAGRSKRNGITPKRRPGRDSDPRSLEELLSTAHANERTSA